MVRASVRTVFHEGRNLQNTLKEWKGYRGVSFKKISCAESGIVRTCRCDLNPEHKGHKETRSYTEKNSFVDLCVSFVRFV